MEKNNKPDLKGVSRKIFAAFLLLSVSIFLAFTVARFSFHELVGTVDTLSQPNEKLTLLNKLFEEITTLDQLQRAEAIENPRKPYHTFIEQSVSLDSLIDSIKSLTRDTSQLHRLDEMKAILDERNTLFFSYLKVKADLLENREFSVQLDTLASILENDALATDSSVVTTQKKTTTTYLPDTTPAKKSDQRSLLRKLFSRKKNKEALDTPLIRIREELSVVIDTLSVARQNEALKEIERMMREMDSAQQNQRQKLQQQELDLVHSNSLFIHQLLNILHSVENEELAQIQATNHHAVNVMNQSLFRINLIMFGFFVAAAVLVYLIWIDISRSNFYKEELEKARDEAEQLGQIKQRFLANMSHEIRTPLQSIIGFAEQLKQKSTKQEEVDAIHSSSEHLLHIVNEVLDYSRIASGSFTLAKEEFRLLAVIKEVEASMRIQAEKKKLTFLLDNEKATGFTLLGDPFRLRQILYNVIGNAIKFTPDGFVKLSVTTKEEDTHVRCIFEVTDTGIGMEQEEMDVIFNQFEQANPAISKKYGGTGLGLTIVKSLIEAQQGSLHVSSTVGNGSTFRIELRYEKAPALLVPVGAQPRSLTRPVDGVQVLLVDDDALILKLCSVIFDKHHIPYSSFNRALELVHLEQLPVATHIFLDIRMPEISGIELCKRLREKFPLQTRFIALTAHVLPEEKEELLQQGFDAILSKPFHENEILELIGVSLSDEIGIVAEKPDFSSLRKLTMGDENLFHSILVQFVEDTRDDLSGIKECLRDQNPVILREIVHKLGGRLSQLGLVSLGSNLHLLEKRLVAGEPVDSVSKDLSKINGHVQDLLSQISLSTIINNQ